MACSFKYGFQGEILQRLWEWIENIQLACCFPGVWKVMFDETWIIQPFCCITEPTLHSCMEFRRQSYDSLRLLYDIKYSICRLQMCRYFNSTKNSSSHKIQIGKKRPEPNKNTQASPRTIEIYCFHVSNVFKLPRFITKKPLKTHSNPTLDVEKKSNWRPWKMRIWIPWIVPPCCPIVPCASAKTCKRFKTILIGENTLTDILW